jgi:hypothetical protein
MPISSSCNYLQYISAPSFSYYPAIILDDASDTDEESSSFRERLYVPFYLFNARRHLTGSFVIQKGNILVVPLQQISCSIKEGRGSVGSGTMDIVPMTFFSVERTVKNAREWREHQKHAVRNRQACLGRNC